MLLKDWGNVMQQSASTTAAAAAAKPIAGSGVSPPRALLKIDQARFDEDFNRRHFMVAHELAEHRLFQIPRLLELAKEMSEKWPNDIYFDLGVTDIGARWSPDPETVSVEDTIKRIETSKAWIDLKSAERSLEYGKVLNACMRDLLQVSGRELEKTMRRKQMAIFITSPNRIATYHMDSEVNFLLQLKGRKQISIFRADDPEVVPETEKEKFWTVDSNAAVYKPALQDRAEIVDLVPGVGVHIPVNAPHWVKNGDNVSVSVALLYHSYPGAYANRYAANHLLRRRLGMTPTPPFRNRFLDTIKQPLGAATLALWAMKNKPAHDPAGNAEGIPDRTPWD